MPLLCRSKFNTKAFVATITNIIHHRFKKIFLKYDRSLFLNNLDVTKEITACHLALFYYIAYKKPYVKQIDIIINPRHYSKFRDKKRIPAHGFYKNEQTYILLFDKHTTFIVNTGMRF